MTYLWLCKWNSNVIRASLKLRDYYEEKSVYGAFRKFDEFYCTGVGVYCDQGRRGPGAEREKEKLWWDHLSRGPRPVLQSSLNEKSSSPFCHVVRATLDCLEWWYVFLRFVKILRFTNCSCLFNYTCSLISRVLIVYKKSRLITFTRR